MKTLLKIQKIGGFIVWFSLSLGWALFAIIEFCKALGKMFN